MGKKFSIFSIRWALNSLGLWAAVRLLGNSYDTSGWLETALLFAVAGLIFSIINSILKPLIVILSLPAILLTLGLFMLVVNGLMVYVSIALAPGLSISFGGAIAAGILMSIVNYIVSASLELRNSKEV